MITFKTIAITLVIWVGIHPNVLMSQNINTILEKHFKSWGQEQVSSIRSMQLVVTEIKGLSDQRKYEVTRKRPNKVRMDGKWQEHQFIYSFDGAEYWCITNTGQQEMTPSEISKLVNSPNIDSPLYIAQKDSLEMVYIGEQTSDEELYLVIQVNTMESRLTYYYINPVSFQVFKTIEKDKGNERYVYQEAFFKNYKPLSGINIPMEYEIRSKGKTTNVIINEIVLGLGIPNSFFKKPQ
ncbi:hypothetical protein [Reichenbachiella sp. MALMAid0571]|uniref:hypothetical protein n=1 Tax=Reichenbachiella sp. MALMAid0571 TaxID=3143939 RepID=UPI0032DF1101